MDIETLKKDYETQRAGGKSSLNLEAALAAAAAASGEEIDVVGGIEDSLDSDGGHPLGPIMNHHHQSQTQIKFGSEADIKKKISPFSIESLLAKRQLSVAMASAQAVASVMKEEAEENNNPPMVSPIPTSCSSPQSRASLTSPPPSTQYMSPSPSPGGPGGHHPGGGGGAPHGPPTLPPNFSLFTTSTPASSSSINHELSLLKPLTACPEKSVFPASFFQKFDPSKISFGNLHPEPPRSPEVSSDHSRPQSPINEAANVSSGGEDKSPPSILHHPMSSSS